MNTCMFKYPLVVAAFCTWTMVLLIFGSLFVVAFIVCVGLVFWFYNTVLSVIVPSDLGCCPF